MSRHLKLVSNQTAARPTTPLPPFVITSVTEVLCSNGESRRPVTRTALLARIRRRLPKGQRLNKARTPKQLKELGEWYVLNYPLPGAYCTHVDLEQLARDIGVLEEGEVLA
jgi:hypothetical protein